MPVGSFVPSRIHYDYPEWTAPASGNIDTGKVWAWNNTTGKYEPASVQPLNANLTAIAGLTSAADRVPYFTGSGTADLAPFTSFGRTLAGLTDASAGRTALGVVIGTDVQAYDAELAAIAGLTSAADRVPYYTGSGTAALATFTGFGRSLVDDADASAARTTLGLGTIATATETSYLLADGSRAGATSSRQVFTNGITTGSIRPASNSTTAGQWQDASGTAIVTVDTTNQRVGIRTTSPDGAFTMQKTGSGISSVGAVFKDNVVPSFSANADNLLSVRGTGASTTTWRGRITVGGDTAALLIGEYNNQAWLGAHNAGLTGWFDIYINPDGNRKALIGRYGSNQILIVDNNTGYSLFSGNCGFGGVTVPSAFVDIAPSISSTSSLRIQPGTAPSSPNNGDIWYPSSGRLTLRRSTTSEIFATGVQGTGGSATAGASYTTTEQTMLQRVYDAARAFGLLS